VQFLEQETIMMNNKTFIPIAAILGAIAVGLGAFAAHGLKPLLEATGKSAVFDTAVRYHFYHTFAILFVALYSKIKKENQLLNWVNWSFLFGIIVFSGSLYLLSFTGISWLGAITPIGGVFFILGWILLFFSSKKD
jgi:uncharacterized membrane protein YgdD (TMEM256/DUF423 family)